MEIQGEAMSFTEEAEVRMQELAEFLGRESRINLTLGNRLHEAGVLLTPGAFLMLAIPLLESARAAERAGTPTAGGTATSPDVLRRSITTLLESMKQDPAPGDRTFDEASVRRLIVRRKKRLRRDETAADLGPRDLVRSSLSVVRAFAKRFTEIPPFGGAAGS